MNEETGSSGYQMRDYMPQEESENEPEENLKSESEEVSEDTSDDGDEVQTPAEQTEEVSDSEESFADNFDPKSLSPELQTAYKQMQSDYTKKTQEIAEVRRNAESYKRYQALINYLGEHPEIADQVLNVRTKVQEQEVETEELPDNPKDFAKYVQSKAEENALKKFMDFYNQDKQREARARYIREQSVEASKLDDRLNTDERFGRIISSMVLAQREQIDRGEKTIVDATKEAIELYDSNVKLAIEQEKERLTTEAKKKRNPIPQGSPSEVREKSTIPQSIREAYEMSFGGK
jgi:hypothetical protein